MEKIVSLLGRIFLGLIFFLSGLSKLGNFEGTQQTMMAKGIPMAPLFLYGAILFEILGSLSLMVGYHTRIGIILLGAFLIPTTIIFHGNFADQEQSIHFLKNIAIMGGLLHIWANGPGLYALEKGKPKKFPGMM